MRAEEHKDPTAEVKLYVGNLSYDTDEEGLRFFYFRYGDVSDRFLPKDLSSDRPRGFAFVTM